MPLKIDRVSLRETWYGDAEPYRGGTRLFVKVGPTFPREVRANDVLVFTVPELVGYYGALVLATTRVLPVPPGYFDSESEVWKNWKAPRGQPDCIVDISWNPSKTDGYGAWQSRLTGEWAVRLTRYRPRTRWEALRG